MGRARADAGVSFAEVGAHLADCMDAAATQPAHKDEGAGGPLVASSLLGIDDIRSAMDFSSWRDDGEAREPAPPASATG